MIEFRNNNKNMFKPEEANALLAFLGRCNLNGNEAETMVYLKNKVVELTEKADKPKAEKVDK